MAHKNILREKTKIKKPAVKISNILDDAVRVRNNEQARLRRIEDKLSETRNRTEKAKIKKELDRQIKSVDKLKKTVVQARDYNRKVAEYNQQARILKSKNTRLNKKLEKLYEGGIESKEYKELSTQTIKNKSLINEQKDKAGKLLYTLNKKLGIKPEEIVGKVKMSKSFIKKNFAKDLGESYIEGISHEQKKKQIEKRAEEEEELGVDEDDYEFDNSSLFWTMWKNWDKVESPRVQNYDRITFVIDGDTYSFKGKSISLANMKAADMWAVAMEHGSDTYVTRYRSVDNKKLKYVIEY